MFMQESEFENVICSMMAILSQPQDWWDWMQPCLSIFWYVDDHSLRSTIIYTNHTYQNLNILYIKHIHDICFMYVCKHSATLSLIMRFQESWPDNWTAYVPMVLTQSWVPTSYILIDQYYHCGICNKTILWQSYWQQKSLHCWRSRSPLNRLHVQCT